MKPTVRDRAGRELRKFAVVAGYLYLCFGAILVYKAAVLHGQGVSYTPWGLAAVKAAILGKFILLGDAMGVGDSSGGRPLIWSILRKALASAALLVVLTLIEEALDGLVHGRSVVAALSDLAGARLAETMATCLILFMILLPYFALRVTGEALGPGRLRRLFFAPGGATDADLFGAGAPSSPPRS